MLPADKRAWTKATEATVSSWQVSLSTAKDIALMPPHSVAYCPRSSFRLTGGHRMNEPAISHHVPNRRGDAIALNSPRHSKFSARFLPG